MEQHLSAKQSEESKRPHCTACAKKFKEVVAKSIRRKAEVQGICLPSVEQHFQSLLQMATDHPGKLAIDEEENFDELHAFDQNICHPIVPSHLSDLALIDCPILKQILREECKDRKHSQVYYDVFVQPQTLFVIVPYLMRKYSSRRSLTRSL